MGARETPLGRVVMGLSKQPAKRKPGKGLQVEGRGSPEEPGGRPGWEEGGRGPGGHQEGLDFQSCSGALRAPGKLSRQERFWLSQARAGWGMGPKETAPPMGSALNHAPLRLGPRPVGPWAAEGGITP